jgi:hypothetical protein
LIYKHGYHLTMKEITLFLMLIFCLGCTRPSKINIAIALIDSNKSLKISGFDKEVINDIAQNSADSAWQALLPVYKMPLDTDMKDFQNAQPGKYEVKDSLVVFTPDTPFRKGQVYFLRSFDYNQARDAWAFVREQKQKGSIGHKDLLFKY